MKYTEDDHANRKGAKQSLKLRNGGNWKAASEDSGNYWQNTTPIPQPVAGVTESTSVGSNCKFKGELDVLPVSGKPIELG